jgi:hypothetical protein
MKGRCQLSTASLYVLTVLTVVSITALPSEAWAQWVEDGIPVCAADGEQHRPVAV